MTDEIHHRRRLPPIERFIRRVGDKAREWRSRNHDMIELACYVVIAIILTGLALFCVETMRMARP